MKKILGMLLLILSSSAFATMPWVNPATIPAPYYGTNVVSTVENTGVIIDYNYGGKTRLNFKVFKYSKEDPIVSPGVDAAHIHMFFGNSCITKFSTVADLFACDSSTMTGGSANKSAYWMPPIIDIRTGAIIEPYQTLLYYTVNGFNASLVKPIPAGLKILAGDSKATGAPITPNTHYTMSCKDPGVGFYQLDDNGVKKVGGWDNNAMPNCFGADDVQINFNFPNCWDGVNLDSSDHKSHMAYSTLGSGRCPATHPVVIPTVTAVFNWRVVNDFDSKSWRLSSDMYDDALPGGYTMHMDLFSAWQPKFINMLVNNVLIPTKESGMGWIGVDPDTGIDSRFAK